jgi:Flp pilus assembly protein TadD
MSLIMDAQKAAQREKDRRAGGGDPDRVPLLVQLKSKGASGTNWMRLGLVSGAAVAVAAAAWMYLKQGDAVPRALRTPGPTVANIAPPPVVTAGSDTVPVKAPTRVAESKTRLTKQSHLVSPPPIAPRREPASSAPRPATNTPRVVRETPTDAGRSTGLSVSVDQPRAVEIARLMALGVAAHRAGNVSAARSAYEQVLVIAPNESDALNNLGVLHTGLREYDRAEALLRRALVAAPANAGAWNNLGTVLRERGRTNDAVAAFQRAIVIDPHHTGARVGLAQQYLVIGSLPQAQRLLDEVIRDQPTSAEANYALGQVLERLGDREGAIRAYDTFVRVAPPSFSLYVEAVRRRIDALSSRTP